MSPAFSRVFSLSARIFSYSLSLLGYALFTISIRPLVVVVVSMLCVAVTGCSIFRVLYHLIMNNVPALNKLLGTQAEALDFSVLTLVF